MAQGSAEPGLLLFEGLHPDKRGLSVFVCQSQHHADCGHLPGVREGEQVS